MRKFLIKTTLLLLAAAALLVWLRPDASALTGGGVLGMDDSSGWLAANIQSPKPFDILEAVQADMLRVSLPWGEVEPAADAFVWSYQSQEGFKDFDQLLSLLEKRGIQAVLVLEGGPPYSSHLYPQQPVSSEELLARWEGYVRAAVARFGNRVNYWQIGTGINDPASWGSMLFPGEPSAESPPDPLLYGEMLHRAHTIIKSAQPGDSIILGSLTLGDACDFSPLSYLYALQDLNLWSSFDAISIELPVLAASPEISAPDTCGTLPLEQTGMPLTDNLRAVDELITSTGHKALWVHGLAFSADMLAEQAAQRGVLPQIVESDYLTRASGLLLSYGGADRVFWRYAPQSALPGALALQSFANLNHALGRANSAKTETIFENGREELRFRGGGRLAILTWRSLQGDQPEATTLADLQGFRLHAYSSDAAALKAKYGVKLPIDAIGGTALMVSERPVLIVGQPSDLKSAASMFLSDLAAQTKQNLQAKAASWMHAQKAKAADKVGAWVEAQQKSLLDLLKDSFSLWLRRSLGLAKL